MRMMVPSYIYIYTHSPLILLYLTLADFFGGGGFGGFRREIDPQELFNMMFGGRGFAFSMLTFT